MIFIIPHGQVEKIILEHLIQNLSIREYSKYLNPMSLSPDSVLNISSVQSSNVLKVFNTIEHKIRNEIKANKTKHWIVFYIDIGEDDGLKEYDADYKEKKLEKEVLERFNNYKFKCYFLYNANGIENVLDTKEKITPKKARSLVTQDDELLKKLSQSNKTNIDITTLKEIIEHNEI